ncbi:hypothetical protein AMELA_G00279120 [Ameiurus melas]|uniref:Uncharacterized protein n=1 Tax=Ameiurus melas TaxID=219545 RepID=A0A7J5ZMX4_AMEME|nr:hypothetical protein AMELA_G00279120 [Ameiurus melas]
MGHRGVWSLSQGTLGTPWTGCQPIDGHNLTHIRTPRTIWKCRSAYYSCLWIGGRNPGSTWRTCKSGIRTPCPPKIDINELIQMCWHGREMLITGNGPAILEHRFPLSTS